MVDDAAAQHAVLALPRWSGLSVVENGYLPEPDPWYQSSQERPVVLKSYQVIRHGSRDELEIT